MNGVASTDAPKTSDGPGRPATPVNQSDARPTGAPVVASPGTVPSDPSVPRRLIGPVLAVARAVNPWVLRLAGRRGVPIAVVRHRGRRSGRRYATPVVVVPTRGGFVISLPYGSGVGWCRNVLASGTASVRWQGAEHALARAEVLGAAAALPLFPAVLRPVLRLVRMRQFLRLHPAPPRTWAPSTNDLSTVVRRSRGERR